ncbi:MAG: RNA polymerase sigma factor [Planctomycetota bacterium]
MSLHRVLPPDLRTEFLRHQPFLSALARRLVADDEADDLAQEAWVNALSREPATVTSPRGWLAKVLRTTALERGRANRRRARREAAVAAVGEAPAAADVAASLEVQRAVANAAADLSEPYRTVVYLRFYRGHSAADIATDLRVPVETVRTRLKRAAALLRDQLDRDLGQRRRWVALLTPLARAGALAPAIGVTVTNTSKLTALAAAILLTASGLGVWWGAAIADPDPPTAPAGTLAAPVAVAPEGAAATPRARQSVPLAEAEPVPPPARTVRGRLLVTDEHGVVWPRTSGQFRLAVVSGEDAVSRAVEVRDGQWSISVPPQARLRAYSFQVQDRLAVLDEPESFAASDEPIDFHARFLGAVLLRVVDAASGAELPVVEVRSRARWRAFGADLHPGDHRAVASVARDVPSPVVLPPAGRPVAYWARAPGYAWGRIDVQHDRPGERTVTLDPGGDVTVTPTGTMPEEAFVRLTRLDPVPAEIRARMPLGVHSPTPHAVEVRARGQRPVTITGFLPGRYTARVQVGSFEAARTAGEAECEVVAGGTAAVAVPVVDEAVAKAPLRGSLFVPPELVDVPLGLSLTRLDDGEEHGQEALHLSSRRMREDPSDARRLLWEAPPVVPGRYVAYVSPVQHRLLFTVTPHGADLAVELPAVGVAELALRDAATGRAVSASVARWSDGELPGLRRNLSLDAAIDRRAGTVSFQAVAGPVTVHVEAAGYLPVSLEWDLQPGTNQRTVELTATLGMVFEARHRGSLVPMPFDFWSGIQVTSPPGAPPPAGGRASTKRATRYFSQPGTYHVRFPDLAGYAPLPPREVVLTAGMTEVVIELTEQ